MQIIAFLFLLLAVVLIFSIKEGLSKSAKWTLFGALLGVSILAFLYENYTDNIQERNRAIINGFEQGKNIICDKTQVNNEKFNYENGTQSFVAKKEFKNLSGIIVPISNCTP